MDKASLKAEILDFLDSHDETVLVSEPDKERLRSLCEALRPHTAEPRPMHNQQAAEGVWRSRFTSFGAKHSENQPLRHTSSLMVQSFGKLPNVPAHVTRIQQEIDSETKAYNNVVFIENEARSTRGYIIVRGRYSENAENPQRYQVAFYRVELHPAPGETEAGLRAGFGLPDDADLAKEFRPPALHSDIVFVDDTMRINYGGLGGFYIMDKLNEAPYSFETPA